MIVQCRPGYAPRRLEAPIGYAKVADRQVMPFQAAGCSARAQIGNAQTLHFVGLGKAKQGYGAPGGYDIEVAA
jgi:hypothetical protein